MKEQDIEKLSGIVARQVGIVLKRGDCWGVFKENDGYVLMYRPEELVEHSEESLIGVILHEACHIKYGSFEISIKDFKKPITNYPQQLQWLLNSLENWRIENLATEDYPRARVFFTASYKHDQREQFHAIDAFAFAELLDRARFGHDVSYKDFHKKSDINNGKIEELGKDIKTALPIVIKYSSVKTKTTRVAYVEEVWKIYEKYLEEEPKTEPQGNKGETTIPNPVPIPYNALRRYLGNLSGSLREKLRQLKLSEKDVSYPNKTSGKLNLKKLYRAGSNDPRVFSKKYQQKADYPEFSVWLDTSGSMIWDDKIYFALAGLILIAEALESIDIKFTMGHFAKDCHIIKHHYEKLKKIHIEEIYKKFGGGTHEYKALRLAYNNFSDHRGKKVIILITDGKTENMTNLKATMNYLKDKTKVIAVGINLLAENLSLFPNKILTTPAHLPNDLYNILKQELRF